MSTVPSPSENELHAYVDGCLEAGRQPEVEDWLARHPEEAARVQEWRALNASLRAAFNPVLAEIVPEKLDQAALRPTPQHRSAIWRSAAAVGWLILGSLFGYGAHDLQADRVPPPPTLAHRAAIAHVVYAPEVRHPVEVGADQETHLVQWLSKRLATSIKAPHLSAEGYALVGGRLLPGEAGPVAQFMYEDATGKRLTLYIRNDAGENRETAFHFSQEGRVGVFYWLDGSLGYALSAELPREQLLGLATSVYRQLGT